MCVCNVNVITETWVAYYLGYTKWVADGFFTQKKIVHDFLYEIAKSLEHDKVALEKQYTF